MKCIYVAHPYQGKKQNREAITHICQRLVKLGVMPVSPIHAFGFLHDNIPGDRHKALEFCEELLTMSDELWLFGEWEKSDGCVFERNVALVEMIPTRVVTGWIAGRDGYIPIFDDAPEWLKLGTEKPLAETEGEKEINHLDCTINATKIESLVDFPLVELGPWCKACECFNCSLIGRCHLFSPSTIGYCKNNCRGIGGNPHCKYFTPRTLEEITKRED